MAALLDVNALIALVDSDHVDHSVIAHWFGKHHRAGWATCPVTENGLVRVISQPSYPSGRRTPAEGIEILRQLKRAFAKSHEFWHDELSLTDTAIFKAALIAGPHNITDSYLIALAAQRKGTLVSFDRSLPWFAIQGAAEKSIQHPA